MNSKEQAFVRGGRLPDNLGNPPEIQVNTDRQGAFTISSGPSPARLLVLHEKGYAILDWATFKSGDTIALIPWATIEGTAAQGGKPALGAQISASLQSFLLTGNNIDFQLDATAAADGKFSITHVPAIELTVQGPDGWKTVHPEGGEDDHGESGGEVTARCW